MMERYAACWKEGMPDEFSWKAVLQVLARFDAVPADRSDNGICGVFGVSSSEEVRLCALVAGTMHASTSSSMSAEPQQWVQSFGISVTCR